MTAYIYGLLLCISGRCFFWLFCEPTRACECTDGIDNFIGIRFLLDARCSRGRKSLPQSHTNAAKRTVSSYTDASCVQTSRHAHVLCVESRADQYCWTSTIDYSSERLTPYTCPETTRVELHKTNVYYGVDTHITSPKKEID